MKRLQAIGFFGIFVYVFADGGITERLITILVILIIYFVFSGLLGFLLPKYSWRWGLLSGAAGVLSLGGWAGSLIGKNKKKQQ